MLGLFGSETKNYGGGSGECYNVDICPDILLAAIAVAASVAFFLLYQAITMVPAGKKRRKRDKEQNFYQGDQHNIG